MYEHSALISVQHPGQQLKNFRAGESIGDPLSSQSSSFQSVCIIDQLWMAGNVFGLQEYHRNYFPPTGMNLQNEQDLYLRSIIPQWTMQNKVALKISLLTQPLSHLFTIKPSLGLRTHSTPLNPSRIQQEEQRNAAK